MQRYITRGAAANAGLIFHVFAQDSTSTVGAGKASVAFGSWTCYYIRSGEAISGAITPQDITTIGTYAAPTANTNIRIKAVDNTNMIGIYEVQIHLDWVNTTNSCQSLTIFLSASGVAVLPVQIPLEAWNRQDAVRGGLTALPNAAAEAAGGLYTRGTGAGQINQPANGMVDVNDVRLLGTAWQTPTVAGVPNVNVKTWNDLTTVELPLVPTTAGRKLDVSTGGEAGLDWANIGSPTTAQGLSGTTISTAQVVASVTGAVGSVTGAVGSVTGSVGGNVTGSVGSVLGNVGGNVTGSVGSVLGNVNGNVAGSVDSVVDPVTVGTNNDKTGYTLSTAGNNSAADALLDRADAVETGLTPRGEMRLTAAASAGKLSGAATTNVLIRNAVQDSKVRIDATVDAVGNRTAVTTDVA